MSVLNLNEKSVRDELAAFLSRTWRAGWKSHALSGFGVIDAYAVFPKCVCIIEVELKREDPANNVAKIYRYLEQDNSEFRGKQVIFVHAFSPRYRTGSPATRRRNAEFIGKKMDEQHESVKYLIVEFNSLDSLKTGVSNAIRKELHVSDCENCKHAVSPLDP